MPTAVLAFCAMPKPLNQKPIEHQKSKRSLAKNPERVQRFKERLAQTAERPECLLEEASDI